MKPRTIIVSVVLHPTSYDWIEHARQVLESFVAPFMEFPPFQFLSDFLDGLVADCWQEADEVFASVVFGSPGPELITKEGKLLVFVISFSVRILAINDFGLLEIKLQSTFCQPPDDGFAQALSYFSSWAVQYGIIRITLKRYVWIMPRHPLIQGIVQKQVCQQRRNYSTLWRPLAPWRLVALPILSRGF